jgi:transposase
VKAVLAVMSLPYSDAFFVSAFQRECIETFQAAHDNAFEFSGYAPATKVGAELLFDVIATAYERSSVMVTTNLPFENWTEALGSERLTGATLDQLTHCGKIIETKGKSYRLQDAAKRSRTRKS